MPMCGRILLGYCHQYRLQTMYNCWLSGMRTIANIQYTIMHTMRYHSQFHTVHAATLIPTRIDVHLHITKLL